MAVTTQIVTLSVTQQVAPNPSQLQQTGAFVSQGGTTGAANSLTLLTTSAGLTSILTTPLALSSLTWASSTVTATASAAHGLTVSQVYYLTIAGAVPTGYNGTYACTVTSTTAFTYSLATNPGAETSPGTWTTASNTELQQMNATFWAQGSSVPVYVLELGPGSVATGTAALTTWLTNNPTTVYSFLVPRAWDNSAGIQTLIAAYAATTARTYFWITTTNATYSVYDTNNYKSAITWIEAPSLPATEFSAAAPFWVALSYNPSSTNKVTQFCYAYLYGVTSYPTVGNQTLFTNWKTAGVNYIAKATEGGASNAMVAFGTTMDNNAFNYWYAADWIQINMDLNLANEIINGSNTPQAPLYYNQDGINRLQARAAAVLKSGVTFGMILGTVVQTGYDGPTYALALEQNTFLGNAVINAIPFVAYNNASPGDYKNGVYNGLSATLTPLRGFENITFYLTLTNLVPA